MPELNHFRTFEISQDGAGNAFELSRSAERVVCLAFDARFGCFCEIAALTQLAGEGSTTMEEFLEQASTVAGLHHRGLATLLDYGDDQGVRFYAVEFVDGEALSDYARRVNGLPPALAFALCSDVADALGAISVLRMPIAAGKARVTLDDCGRLRVRIVDYPLGLVHPEGPRDAAAGVFELAHLLEELASGEVIGAKGCRAAEVAEVAERLRQIVSIHDAATMLREAASDGSFLGVEARHRPKLMLAQKLFLRGSPEELLSDDYRVEQAPLAAADPYSIDVVRVSESRALRMHVLPPDYILSDEGLPIYETEKSTAVVGAEALWRSEHFRLVSEDRFPGFSLTALLRQAHELSDLEVLLLLDHVETAILEARSIGAELTKVHPDNVLLHFKGWGFSDAEALIRHRPMTKWPDFAVVLRAHQTMRGLTTLTPNAKQRFLQMRARFEHGESVCNLQVLELYLQLQDSGRPEQAEELLDRFEQSCKAAMEAALSTYNRDRASVEQVEEEEVLSPIALSVAGAQATEVAIEEDLADEDEPVLSPLAGGSLFGGGLFENRVEDAYGEDEIEEEDVGPVISPIAAALGVVEEDLDLDEDYSGMEFGMQEPANLGHEGDEDDEEAEEDEALELGLGSGLFGDGEADEEKPDESVPAGLNPLPSEEDGSLPELKMDAADGGSRGLKFHLAMAAVVAAAFAVAAAIAHLSGKAFWLR